MQINNCRLTNVLPLKSKYYMKWNVTPLIGDFGGKAGIYRFLRSPPIPRMLPPLFICRDFLSFCPFNQVLARLQAQGTAMSALGEVQKKEKKSAPRVFSERAFPDHRNTK